MLTILKLKRSGYRGTVYSRDNIYYYVKKQLKHGERTGFLLSREDGTGRCYEIWDDAKYMLLKGYNMKQRWEITDLQVVQINKSIMF